MDYWCLSLCQCVCVPSWVHNSRKNFVVESSEWLKIFLVAYADRNMQLHISYVNQWVQLVEQLADNTKIAGLNSYMDQGLK